MTVSRGCPECMNFTEVDGECYEWACRYCKTWLVLCDSKTLEPLNEKEKT